MSYAQLKKRFAELREYLGKDKEGIRRLDLVKDEVTELRKSLATANEETQLAVTIKDAARERADAAEAALTEAKVENQKLRNQIGSLMFDLSTVTRPKEPEEVNVAVEGSEESEIRKVVRALRKKLRLCPPMLPSAGNVKVTLSVYDRDEIATGWSHSRLWTLGASVAILSILQGVVGIRSRKQLLDMDLGSEHSPMVQQIDKWYSENNMARLTVQENKLYDAVSMDNQSRFSGEID